MQLHPAVAPPIRSCCKERLARASRQVVSAGQADLPAWHNLRADSAQAAKVREVQEVPAVVLVDSASREGYSAAEVEVDSVVVVAAPPTAQP